jgi:hypothetical protein
MREMKLPSGAVLKIKAAPWAEAKALYKAVLKEMREVEIKGKTDVLEMYKNLFCTGFSSDEIDSCLSVCMKRCTYNDLKIDQDTFEKEEAREDYVTVCVEIAKENVLPFLKSLYAEFQRISAEIEGNQASRPAMTT